MADHPERTSPPSDRRAVATAEAEAADWLARRDRGLSAREEAALAQWLAARPQHAAAWREVLGAWETLDRPRRAGAAAGMIRELSARRRRRQRWTVAVAGGALAAAAWILVSAPRGAPTAGARAVANAATLVRWEPERRTLTDGSVVELDTGAELEVDFSPGLRAVRLRRGTAHFAVAKNPARPFVVSADTAAVKAVGTAFTVRAGTQGAAVVVTEGTVAVSRPATPAVPPTLVPAGHRTLIGNGSGAAEPPFVVAVTAAELVRLEAWRAPRLQLADTPLWQIVAALNRENAMQLEIGDAALAQMRLSGVLRADDAAGLVRLLETNYAVRVEREPGNRLVLRTAP